MWPDTVQCSPIKMHCTILSQLAAQNTPQNSYEIVTFKPQMPFKNTNMDFSKLLVDIRTRYRHIILMGFHCTCCLISTKKSTKKSSSTLRETGNDNRHIRGTPHPVPTSPHIPANLHTDWQQRTTTSPSQTRSPYERHTASTAPHPCYSGHSHSIPPSPSGKSPDYSQNSK